MLYNFQPPTTELEVRAAAVQFVRKVSGLNAPSAADTAAFNQAVDEVAASTRASPRLSQGPRARADPRRRAGEGTRPVDCPGGALSAIDLTEPGRSEFVPARGETR